MFPPLSTIISILLETIIISLFNHPGAIHVYSKSKRITETIIKSIQYLNEGKSIIIFPEIADKYLNEYINKIRVGFIEITRRAYISNGIKLKIYPVCIDKKKRVIKLGIPAIYDPEKNFYV